MRAYSEPLYSLSGHTWFILNFLRNEFFIGEIVVRKSFARHLPNFWRMQLMPFFRGGGKGRGGGIEKGQGEWRIRSEREAVQKTTCAALKMSQRTHETFLSGGGWGGGVVKKVSDSLSSVAVQFLPLDKYHNKFPSVFLLPERKNIEWNSPSV